DGCSGLLPSLDDVAQSSRSISLAAAPRRQVRPSWRGGAVTVASVAVGPSTTDGGLVGPPARPQPAAGRQYGPIFVISGVVPGGTSAAAPEPRDGERPARRWRGERGDGSRERG